MTDQLMVKTRRHSNKAAQAYQRIRELIFSGEISGGERLIEAKLARQLGMSRGPIRESLLRLESDGLLRSRGVRRSRVMILDDSLDLNAVLERYELREQIESGAARLAAKNMTGWQIDQLLAISEEVCRKFEADDIAGRFDAVERFHKYLVNNCGNRLYAQVYETHRLMPVRPVSSELENRVVAHLPIDPPQKNSLSEVAQAIAARDAQRAEDSIRIRIRAITEALRRMHQEQVQERLSSGGLP
jgi:DNA-binding GntR family transcriptional regulator